ncbi:MAG: glycosyltransferase, partial [Acidobacteria bacterium]|nr:glycosyltransferase [Acidobacteriota bacterium]
MRVTLTAVAYRSSEVLPACIASFRREAAAAGVKAEVVVVEHSEDEDEAHAAAELDPAQLLVCPNRGYAAGINAGVAAATGDVILVANPDVELLEGSLSALLAALDEGFAVVGPRLVWDREGRVSLPIPEDPSPRAEIRRAARRRWPALWRRWLGGWLDELWGMWTAVGTIETVSLRGPALIFRRRDFSPWDESYFLYYEETEWLWRMRRGGGRLAVAPQARVLHHWGHATRNLEGRQNLEAASRRRFLQRTMGPLSRAVMGAVGSGPEK